MTSHKQEFTSADYTARHFKTS